MGRTRYNRQVACEARRLWITAIVVVALAVTAVFGAKLITGRRNSMVMEARGPNPIVTVEMENGAVIRIELYPDIAPNTVRNFIYLVSSGFYDGTMFHRVIPGFMIQEGDPQGTGMGGLDTG